MVLTILHKMKKKNESVGECGGLYNEEEKSVIYIKYGWAS